MQIQDKGALIMAMEEGGVWGCPAEVWKGSPGQHFIWVITAWTQPQP